MQGEKREIEMGEEKGIFTSLRFHFVYWLLKNDGRGRGETEEEWRHIETVKFCASVRVTQKAIFKCDVAVAAPPPS